MQDTPHTTSPLSAPPAWLHDRLGRRVDYLRISVTDRCDLRCTYCMPQQFKGFEEPAHWLSHAEMARLAGLFVALGVRKVRLTGGEPLLRRGLDELVSRLRAMPQVEDIALSTNATRLARHAAPLREAGVDRLNVSLDSLDGDCFARVTGRDCLGQVLEGLTAAKAAGFSPIKLNMVVQQGVNDHEVPRLLAFAMAQGFVLRLIEPMPVGDTGRSALGLDLTAWTRELAAREGLVPEVMGAGAGPARYWRSADGRMSLGVITPMSQHFCEACNRVRLTVDGTLLLCLGQEDQVPLGRMLRQGASDDELRSAIRDAVWHKPERHEFREQPAKVVRFMSQTGG
mgnify:CR=1 FL=1